MYPRGRANGCRAEAWRQSSVDRSRTRMSDTLQNSFGENSVGGPMPANTGIGLRAPHHLQVLSESPDVSWFEAHSENYFA
jgi:hypothetical protein